MEPERKHEEHVGEVREFIDKFKDFWEKYGGKLMTVAIVGLLIYGSFGWYHRWKERKEEEAYSSLASAGTADMLLAVSGEQDLVHDEALRRQADTLFASAVRELNAGNNVAAEGEIAKALTAYSTLAERGITPEYKLVGLEGMAKLAEAQENWDQAKGFYQQMIDLAGERFTEHARRAQVAIDRLDLIRNTPDFSADAPQVNFQPQPAPEPTTPTAPFDISAPDTPDEPQAPADDAAAPTDAPAEPAAE